MRIKITKELTNTTELLENLWSGGLETAKGIISNGDEKELITYIEECFEWCGSDGDLNDLIWFTENEVWVKFGVSYYFKMDFPENVPMNFEKLMEKLWEGYVYIEEFEEAEEEDKEDFIESFDIFSSENNRYVCSCNIEYNRCTNKYTLNF